MSSYHTHTHMNSRSISVYVQTGTFRRVYRHNMMSGNIGWRYEIMTMRRCRHGKTLTTSPFSISRLR
ncbi:unnamed protein product [Haemonchus placei]|uniref:PAW domain-containing protein n=1 Tax=Haemonchus placei TaxID=6290 RepID=A0A0N4VZZ7_HAEPC|nr:unnamed protein product [Haemonchus placei]